MYRPNNWREQATRSQTTLPVVATKSGQVQTEQPGIVRKGAGVLADIGIGATKGAFSTLLNLGEGYVDYLSARNPLKAAAIESLSKKTTGVDLRKEAKKTIERGKEELQPEGTAQNIGFAGERIGEFFLPGAAGLSGAKALTASRQALASRGASKLAQKVVPRLAQIGTEAATQFAVGTAQTGEVTKENIMSSVAGGASSVLGRLPQAAIGSGQIARGVNQISEGDLEQGVTTIGFGALGMYGALKSKGLIFDQPISEKLATPQVSGAPRGVGVSPIPLPTGNFAQKLGKKMQNVELRPVQSDYRAGFDVNNVAKYGVGGSVPEVLDQTQRRIAGYMNTVDEIAREYGDPLVVDYNTALKAAKDKYIGPGKSLNQKAYQEAISRLEFELDLNNPGWRVGNKDSFKNGLQTKRLAGIQAAFEHDPVKKLSTPAEDIYNEFYFSLKTQLEENAPEAFKEANKAIAELIPIQNAALRRIPIEGRNNVISLSDLLGGLSVAIDPKAIPVTLLSRALRNPQNAKLLMSLGRQETPFIPGAIPKRPSFPMLPEGSTVNLPGSFSNTSGVQSQQKAVENLRSQGFQGPLTQEDFSALRGKGAFATMSKLNGTK